MKATLTFDLPEDNEEYKVVQNAGGYLATLQDLDNFLRGKLKYGDLPEEVDKIYEEVRDKLLELANKNDAPIW